MWPRFYIRSTLGPYVTVLSDTNEAFIYLGRRTIGQSGSIVGILLTSLIQIYPRQFDTRDDLLLIHIRSNGTIQNMDEQNFGFGGSIFPMNGSIYYIRGVVNGTRPRIWQLENDTFIELDDVKASAVSGSFTFTSDLIKAGGWKEVRIRFDDGKTNFPFSLGTGKCVLTLTQVSTNGNILQTISIHGEGINIPDQVLTVQNGKSKSLSRAEYMKEVSKE